METTPARKFLILLLAIPGLIVSNIYFADYLALLCQLIIYYTNIVWPSVKFTSEMVGLGPILKPRLPDTFGPIP